MNRKRWRRLGIALAILTVALIVIAVVMPRLLDLNRYHGVIVSTIQKAVGGTVSLGRISWGFSPGIWLEVDDVSLADASAFPGDLSASRVYVSVSIPPLLHKQIVLNRVLLESPDVRLRLGPSRQDGSPGPSSVSEGAKGQAAGNTLQGPVPCSATGTGESCPSAPAATSSGDAGPIRVEIRQLTIEKGHVTVEDGLTLPGQRMVRAFSDVDITATQEIPGGGIVFDVALRDEAPAGLGALRAQGNFHGLTDSLTINHPQLNAKATLSSLHVETITPYLRGSPLGKGLSGSASLTVQYDGDLRSHHRAEGSIDISRLAYTDPPLWPSALASADAAITYRVSLTPDELTVEHLVLKLGPLSVRASGRVSGLGDQPILKDAECSADLPLPELARFIPWKVVGNATATLQPLFENGGRIVIDRAVVPDIALAGPPTPAENVLRKIELTAHLLGMAIHPVPSIPTFRNIRGTVQMVNGIILVQGLRAQAASVELPDISAKLTNVFRFPRIEATIKGPLTLTQTPDAEMAALLRQIAVEEASGAAELDLAVTVDTAQPENFQLQGHVGLRDVKAKAGFSPARLEGLTADLAITPDVTQIAALASTVMVPAVASAPVGRFRVQLQGRVDGWRRQPVITLQHLNTDPVPLPAVASLLPWEKLGESARPVKALLLAGGTARVEELTLPPIKLSAPPTNAAQLVSRAKAAVSVADLAVQPIPDLPRFEGITGHLSLTNGTLTAADVRGRMGPLSVGSPGVSATITRLLDTPRVQGTLKGQLTLAEPPGDQALALFRRLGVEEASGTAVVDLAVTVDTSQPENFQVQGRVGLREVKGKTGFSPARLEGLTADLAITPAVAQIARLSTTVVVPATASAPDGRFTVQLQGRVDGWRERPAITLQHFRTSPISLPVYAELMPWAKLGGSARHVKELLLPSGTVAIEALTLPPISLSPLPNPAQLIPSVKATVSVTDLAVQPSPDLPRFEGITGHLSLTNGTLTATDVQGRVGPLSLPPLNIRVTNIGEHPKVAMQAKGPLHVAATNDADVELLLRRYGLRSLTGQAMIDMHAEYDRHTPDDWEVHGTLVLGGVRVESYPEAVVLDGLRGRVTVNRAKTMDIFAENVTAQVNQAPVRLSGKFLGVGTPGLVVSAKAYAKQLNLAHIGEFFPALKQAGLAGALDMDLSVFLPYADARKSRLNGTLAAHEVGLRLPASDVSVKNGDGEFTCSGNTVVIRRLQLRLNDQVLEVSGRISNPLGPDVELVVTSPDLDLDRLLPPRSADTQGDGSSHNSSTPIEAKTGKSELPAMARKLTGQLQVQAKHGRYRGLTFQDLKLDAAYGHGLLSEWDLAFGFSGGQISATGSADLRDPERAAFVVRPQITSLNLGAVAPVLGIEAMPVTGPLSLTGQLRGRTGSTKDLLASLEGTLDARMGPGTFSRIGRFGATTAKILSFASVRGLLSGSLLRDLTGKGIAYRTITVQTSFDKGSMSVGSLSFRSDAMNVEAQGTVDMIEERLALQVALSPLGTAGRVLGFLPIVGRPVEAMTSIHLEANGSLDDPDVRLAMGRGIGSAITQETERTGSMLRGITDYLQRGTGNLFGR